MAEISTFHQISRITEQYGSPFFLVDADRFQNNYDALKKAFHSRYEKFILAYSYKTNYLPYLCRIIKEKGGWAEVVSAMEYEMALRIGQDPAKIIFNGPVKSQEDILGALDNGSVINLDCESELAFIQEYARGHPEQTVRIGLRMNMGLSDSKGNSHIQQKLKVGRFGFDPEFLKAGDWLSKVGSNLKVVSLHGHTSTTDRSVWCFQAITKSLLEIAEAMLPETVEMINIGGGMFGSIPEQFQWCPVPTLDEYAQAVCDLLNENLWAQKKKPTLTIEPGIAMVADAVSYVTKVVSVKPIRDELFVTVDGSAIHAKPTFHSINMPHEFLYQNAEGAEANFHVVGATCMEKDYLLKDVTASVPVVGDFLKIDNAGAYSLVLTPSFILPAPPVLALEGHSVKLVRKRQTLDNILVNDQ